MSKPVLLRKLSSSMFRKKKQNISHADLSDWRLQVSKQNFKERNDQRAEKQKTINFFELIRKWTLIIVNNTKETNTSSWICEI